MIGLASVLSACSSVPNAPQLTPQSDAVVLIHALGRSPRHLSKMQNRLMEEGFKVINLGYSSLRQDVKACAQEIASQLEVCCSQANRLNFVTHSLGGIVLRQYVADFKPSNIDRVVMIAPPNGGSEVVDRWFYKPLLWVAGPAARELGTLESSPPKSLGGINFELGVIAGNRSRNPFFSLAIPGEDDGAVSVVNTQHKDMADFILLPRSHSRLTKPKYTADQIIHFLNHGRFDHRQQLHQVGQRSVP